jgi:ATP-dependent metalloprotease FtsH
MWQQFQNNLNQKNIDKNLKFMSLSAIVLVVLFFYVMLKSDVLINNKSYYLGIGFLFVLIIVTYLLQKFKTKIQHKINNNKKLSKFAKQLEDTKLSAPPTNHLQKQNQKDDEDYDIKPIKSNITFDDVAGISEIKQELQEVVDFLNHPKKYQKYNVSLPKGVILVGPPGVGKTLIAKAVAGEANVPFFYQSGASFVNIYVGAGAKKVRELFAVAKLHAPSIVFIDEIDAIGKSRNANGNDEREATLNELLTQIDGFNSTSGVMVIAATNKIDILDDALLRAGRFDRRVYLSLPSKQDRLDILNLYLKNTRYNFDVEKLSSDTSGFSSSALCVLINEALLSMIKRDGTTLLEDDIAYAKRKIEFGKKQATLLTQEQKEILSIYQAGKAFVSQKRTYLLEDGCKKIDLKYLSKTDLEDAIKFYLAGRVALEIIKGEPYVVYEYDIKEAYKIADFMVNELKMEQDQTNLIAGLKSNLYNNFTQSILQIKQLQQKLLEDEYVF